MTKFSYSVDPAKIPNRSCTVDLGDIALIEHIYHSELANFMMQCFPPLTVPYAE